MATLLAGAVLAGPVLWNLEDGDRSVYRSPPVTMPSYSHRRMIEVWTANVLHAFVNCNQISETVFIKANFLASIAL